MHALSDNTDSRLTGDWTSPMWLTAAAGSPVPCPGPWQRWRTGRPAGTALKEGTQSPLPPAQSSPSLPPLRSDRHTAQTSSQHYDGYIAKTCKQHSDRYIMKIWSQHSTWNTAKTWNQHSDGHTAKPWISILTLLQANGNMHIVRT